MVCGGGGEESSEDILFWQNPRKFRFVTLPQDVLHKMKLHPWNFQKLCYTPFEIVRPISMTCGNSTWFFLDHPSKFLEFPHFVLSILLEIPCPQPPVCFVFWTSPFTQLNWQFFITFVFPVSDECLIFRCGNLTCRQKKKCKWKRCKYLMKNKQTNEQKNQKMYMFMRIKQHSYL